MQNDYQVNNPSPVGGAIRILDMQDTDAGFVGLFGGRWLWDGTGLYIDGKIGLYPFDDTPDVAQIHIEKRDGKLWAEASDYLCSRPFTPTSKCPSDWRRVHFKDVGA